MKDRISWIDNARGICLLCVIAHHSGHAEPWLTKAYLPVFLTVFFFISGYLFKSPNKNYSIPQKALNIITSLIIPYCIYCCLTLIFQYIVHGYEGLLTDLKISILGIKSWFISAIVVVELFGLCILWIFQKSTVSKFFKFIYLFSPLIFLGIYFVLPDLEYYLWNFRNAMFAAFYFILGMICREYNVSKGFLNNCVGGPLLLIYICLVSLDIHWNLNQGNFNESFTNYSFFIIESLCGVPAMVWLCSKINRYNQFIVFIGSNSLLYYYLQSITIKGIWYCLDHLNINMPNFVEFAVIVIFASLIISIPVVFINKYVPAFSGKLRININDLRHQINV